MGMRNVKTPFLVKVDQHQVYPVVCLKGGERGTCLGPHLEVLRA